MIKETTSGYYKQKSEEVLHYINNNIGADLNIKVLADRFGISFFHFHRIMKAALNESPGVYINRIRLDTALKLLRYSESPITDIAENIGFADLSSFSKAFNKEFGLSPLEYRNDKSLVVNSHIDYRIGSERKIIADIKCKIINLQEKRVCYVNVVGKYGSDAAYKGWDELIAFAMANKLMGWKPDLFAIYYDNPDVLDCELCSSDLCVATTSKFKEDGVVKSKIIEGGKFLVFRYKGSYDYLWDVYNYIYREFILVSDYKLRDLPTVEKYLKYSATTKPEDYLTEIYIPVW